MMVGLEEHMGCWELNQGQPHVDEINTLSAVLSLQLLYNKNKCFQNVVIRNVNVRIV